MVRHCYLARMQGNTFVDVLHGNHDQMTQGFAIEQLATLGYRMDFIDHRAQPHGRRWYATATLGTTPNRTHAWAYGDTIPEALTNLLAAVVAGTNLIQEVIEAAEPLGAESTDLLATILAPPPAREVLGLRRI